MRYAIRIDTRTIYAAARGERFKAQWRYYRFKWAAKAVVLAVNIFGAGPEYEHATYLGETL